MPGAEGDQESPHQHLRSLATYQPKTPTKTQSNQAKLEGQQSFGVYWSVLEKTGSE